MTREQALARLAHLATQMLIGSLSESYRTCGNPGCRCHGPGPKHGPHLYVSYPGEHGRTSGYYVPRAMEPAVREGIEAWKAFHAVAKQLAALNRDELRATHARPRKGRAKGA